MRDYGLFGHLATRFSSSPENLATESLHYVLDRSSVATRAFLRYVAQTGPEFADTLLFRTQASGDDSAIPDLVGSDTTGRQVLLIEAKFWAGLTDHQPVTYLRRLPQDTDALLLVLAPAQRFATLWPELVRRCIAAGIAVEQRQQEGEETRVAQVGAQRVLALASWRSVLTFLIRALEVEGQHAPAANVRQLAGLCDRMDAEAFLPLRSEELTADIAARILQYTQLVDEVTERLVAARLVSTKKLRATGAKGWYGRYMFIGPFAALLHFSAWKWRDRRLTPLWLTLYDVREGKWKFGAEAKARLSSLELEDPPRLLQCNDEVAVPLTLPTGVERAVVVELLLGQMREVIGLLSAPASLPP